MSVRTAHFLVQRSGVKYKVTGEQLLNRDTLILDAGDVFLVERGGTQYKFTVALDINGFVDVSDIQDTDQFVCIDGGTEKKLNGLEFAVLVGSNPWESKDSWYHISIANGEWGLYVGNHDGIYELDGTLAFAAATNTLVSDTSKQYVVAGNSATFAGNYGTDLLSFEWATDIGTRTNFNYFLDSWSTGIGSLDGAWDVSNVTNMAQMFYNCADFQETIDFSTWDVSKVTNMARMFYREGVSEDWNNASGLSSWNTTNVTNMAETFGGTSFNENISSWNVSNVTNMHGLFEYNTIFNQNIGGWDVANVTDMTYMFYRSFAFNQDLSGWCVTNIGSKPSSFDTDAGFAGETALQPQWGTCP